MLDFIALAQQCAPTVAPQTMAAVVKVESGFSPYAIGVVGGKLQRQPSSLEEAVATAQALEANGWNFSVGIAQVNRHNLPAYSLSYESAFDPCSNMRAGSKILEACYTRALPGSKGDQQRALQSALSCYYSGNFTRGFRSDQTGQPSYVQKVVAQANTETKPIPVVPAIAATSVAAPAQQTKQAKGTTRNPAKVSTDPVLLRLRSGGTAPQQANEGTAGQADEQPAPPVSSAIVF